MATESKLLETWYHRPPTAGVWWDRASAARFLDQIVPPTAVSSATVLLLDLSSVDPTTAVLQEYLVTLARRVEANTYGDLRLVVRVQSAQVDAIMRIAEAYGVCYFVSAVGEDTRAARPAGDVSPTDRVTLEILSSLGGRASGVEFAAAAGLEITAALNRLNGLTRKALLLRVHLPGRTGSVYLDPRLPTPDTSRTEIIVGGTAPGRIQPAQPQAERA